MINIPKFLFFIWLSILTACNSPDTKPTEQFQDVTFQSSSNKVVLASEVEWTPLNAARGDQSPQAGTLWGDRSKEVATGFLVKFKEGFSSPPHIHNVTYRGVVIEGLIHNDDPNAEKMWMPAGSFWTQPAGEAHITAAKGTENMAFIEIQEGPYLVKPTEQAFDNGERPLNVDKSNIVWVDLNKKPNASNSPKIAYFWGNPQGEEAYGTLIKLPAGYTGKIRSHGASFRAVVTQGQTEYKLEKETKTLDPGSYFSSNGKSLHEVSSEAGTESILYVRTDGKFEITNN